VALDAQGTLSSRVDGRISGGLTAAHSDSDASLIGEGILLPLDRTRSADAAVGLTWRTAARTSLVFDGTWLRTDFQSDSYLDTTYWTGAVSLAHRVAPRDELSLNGVYRETRDDLTTRRGPTLTAGYAHTFGPALATSSLRLRLDAGAGREENLANAPTGTNSSGWDFYGAALLTGQFRRSSVSLGYRHGRRPQIGLGISEVSDTVNLDLTIGAARWLDLLARGAVSFYSDPDLPTRQDADVYLGAASRLSRRLRLILGYRFRVRDTSPGQVRNDRATVSLAYERGRR
jgi:hypothetical protein